MFATDDWLIARAGVHRSTVARWRHANRFPPALERLALIELHGDLGLIHPAWEGWRLDRSGQLIAPGGMTHTPAELLALPVRYQLLRELSKPRPDLLTRLRGLFRRFQR